MTKEQHDWRIQFLWAAVIVICFLAMLLTFVVFHGQTEETVRDCLKKSVSPNLAGCMAR